MEKNHQETPLRIHLYYPIRGDSFLERMFGKDISTSLPIRAFGKNNLSRKDYVAFSRGANEVEITLNGKTHIYEKEVDRISMIALHETNHKPRLLRKLIYGLKYSTNVIV